MKQIDINTKLLKAVALAASKETRFYLQGVLVECRRDSVTYVATDGVALIAAREGFAAESVDTPTLIGDFIIPAEICEAWTPKKNHLGRDVLQQDDTGQFRLGVAGLLFQMIDGVFPDWRRVIPTQCSGKVAQFNAEQLVKFQRFSKIATGVSHLCELTHNDSGPALVRLCVYGSDQFPVSAFGVVVPVRGEPLEAPPEWLRAKYQSAEEALKAEEPQLPAPEQQAAE